MVKSLASIIIALGLLVGGAAAERAYVRAQFEGFGQEIAAVCEKAERSEAEGWDAEAALRSWEERKKRLQLLLPHNDIARIENELAECGALLEREEYPLALAKLRAVARLCAVLPDNYRPSAGNIL